MQANAFPRPVLIQLATARSAERTVAENHAETAATNNRAASTRLSAFPAHAMAKNAVPTAAAGSAGPGVAPKDKVALLTANV